MISYGDRMPCRISDGPRDPDDIPEEYVELDLTDEWRQQAVDDAIHEILEKEIADELNEFVREIFGPRQAG